MQAVFEGNCRLFQLCLRMGSGYLEPEPRLTLRYNGKAEPGDEDTAIQELARQPDGGRGFPHDHRHDGTIAGQRLEVEVIEKRAKLSRLRLQRRDTVRVLRQQFEGFAPRRRNAGVQRVGEEMRAGSLDQGFSHRLRPRDKATGARTKRLADPIGEDCTAVSVRLGVDPKRLVAIDTHTGVVSRATIMAAPGANEEIVQSVMAMLSAVSGGVTRIKDNPGFVAQRIRAMIANLGCEMAQIGVATPEDIDKGMKLGLNYPFGSVELAEHMGSRNCLKILENLQAITGEDRYRPSQWLRRRALLDLPIHTLD